MSHPLARHPTDRRRTICQTFHQTASLKPSSWHWIRSRAHRRRRYCGGVYHAGASTDLWLFLYESVSHSCSCFLSSWGFPVCPPEIMPHYPPARMARKTHVSRTLKSFLPRAKYQSVPSRRALGFSERPPGFCEEQAVIEPVHVYRRTSTLPTALLPDCYGEAASKYRKVGPICSMNLLTCGKLPHAD